MEKQLETIKSLIEGVLEKMNVKGDVSVKEGADCFQFTIKTGEAGMLIGENGQHLAALNHILKKMTENEFRKNGLERVYFMVDINNYQAKKNEELKNLARMGAQRARYFKKDVTLKPMNSYDRRIIHSALTEYPDIETGSIGREPERRVVIKPYSMAKD